MENQIIFPTINMIQLAFIGIYNKCSQIIKYCINNNELALNKQNKMVIKNVFYNDNHYQMLEFLMYYRYTLIGYHYTNKMDSQTKYNITNIIFKQLIKHRKFKYDEYFNMGYNEQNLDTIDPMLSCCIMHNNIYCIMLIIKKIHPESLFLELFKLIARYYFIKNVTHCIDHIVDKFVYYHEKNNGYRCFFGLKCKRLVALLSSLINKKNKHIVWYILDKLYCHLFVTKHYARLYLMSDLCFQTILVQNPNLFLQSFQLFQPNLNIPKNKQDILILDIIFDISSKYMETCLLIERIQCSDLINKEIKNILQIKNKLIQNLGVNIIYTSEFDPNIFILLMLISKEPLYKKIGFRYLVKKIIGFYLC